MCLLPEVYCFFLQREFPEKQWYDQHLVQLISSARLTSAQLIKMILTGLEKEGSIIQHLSGMFKGMHGFQLCGARAGAGWSEKTF